LSFSSKLMFLVRNS